MQQRIFFLWKLKVFRLDSSIFQLFYITFFADFFVFWAYLHFGSLEIAAHY